MDMSLLALLIRVVVSLGVVLAIMAGTAAVLRRSGLTGTAGPGRRGVRRRPVEVLARHGLSRGASVTVVRLGGRGLVLGVTDHQVTLLTEIDPAELDAPPDDIAAGPAGPPAPGIGAGSLPWKVALEQLRERTVRRS
ncbi:MAG TPA: flagellar biosynthetic protein FliO [Acidimicrobiia bacterium]|jgi:flagellar biosynthetic protein FliO|nr:flagellar biosynthetic protein FliO [Acidimicrobiia bacterium]